MVVDGVERRDYVQQIVGKVQVARRHIIAKSGACVYLLDV